MIPGNRERARARRGKPGAFIPVEVLDQAVKHRYNALAKSCSFSPSCGSRALTVAGEKRVAVEDHAIYPSWAASRDGLPKGGDIFRWELVNEPS